VIPAQLVREAMEGYGVPGVAVGLVHGKDEETAGFGVTSLESPLPVDSDTFVQIGSITKTYVATAAMRLVVAGRLDLDEPVITVIPTLRLADEDARRNVTMRHLLSHTGGWAGDYFGPFNRNDDALERIVATMDRVEQLTPLGEVWAYNNAGFYVAGRMIEVITGKTFDDALRELVLDPLGLERSYFFADDVITHRFAVGHDRAGAVMRPWSQGRQVAPAGGLITTVRDLVTYARAQWEVESFLSAEALAEMRRPHANTGGAPGNAVGLGWYRFESDGHWFLRHGGGTNGQISQLVVAPDDRFALAILTNHDDGGALIADVVGDVLHTELGLAAATEDPFEMSTNELREHEGSYESQRQVVTITLADGALVLSSESKGGFPEPDSPPGLAPPPTRLSFTASDAVVALDPPLQGMRGDFLRTPGGEVAWLRYGGRLHRPTRRET
jgi:CubicO group peptidase (beta-lactamase class C family)